MVCFKAVAELTPLNSTIVLKHNTTFSGAECHIDNEAGKLCHCFLTSLGAYGVAFVKNTRQIVTMSRQ